MKEIQTKSGKILCVEVPEDITWWELIENNTEDFITNALSLGKWFLQYGKSSTIFGKKVNDIVYYNPENFYCCQHYKEASIVGKLSELTDKDCEEFVEKHPNIAYRDYTASTLSKAINEWTVNWNKNSAKESFISLLESEGVDTSKEYLIIKVL